MSPQVKLKVSQEELKIIIEALTELPWKKAHPVILTLDKQINKPSA